MNPFRMLSKREIYENRWIRVIEHQVITPKGKPGIYGIVEYKNRAVGVVPYENGQIWLVGQYRVPLERYSWEIPEGGAPEGEDVRDAANRELREETGMSARTLDRLVEMHLSNSVSNEYAIVFLARGLTHGEASPEETEVLRVRKIPLEEAYALVESGEITDSLTVAALQKMMILKLRGEL